MRLIRKCNRFRRIAYNAVSKGIAALYLMRPLTPLLKVLRTVPCRRLLERAIK